MRIGIIGAGMIGGTLGELWAKAGHEVLLSSRHPETLRELANRVGHGLRVGTPEEAAAFGEVVLLAIPFGATPGLPEALKRSLSGKVLLDAGNMYPQRDGAAAVEAQKEGRGSGHWTAKHLPGARVVKAFNTVYFKTIIASAQGKGERVGVPLASDDSQAMDVAARLVRDGGLDPVPLGALERTRDFDPGTPAFNSGMTGAALRKHFNLG